jgi:hypothetical protein
LPVRVKPVSLKVARVNPKEYINWFLESNSDGEIDI